MSVEPIRRRRGLTLLEVLIATAILAMLAAACLPVITRAMLLLRESSSPTADDVLMIELALAAEDIVANAESLGPGMPDTPLHKIDVVEVAWPLRDSARGREVLDHQSAPIVVRRLPSADSATNHLWLAFTCEGVTVHRWLRIPDEDLPRNGKASPRGVMRGDQ